MNFKKQYFIVAIFFTIVLSSCKKWDDSIAVKNQDLSLTLSAAIAADVNLSKFSEYMVKTGTDILLQSSKTFTVWAPTNDALASLDPAIVNDTAKLRVFVWNHIANQTYFVRDVQASIRVPMLNGKYNNFFGNKLEDANIVTADRYVSNGVLHVIDKSILVLPNLWEFITTTTSQYIQNSFIASLNFNSFDPSLATIDSISFLTGLPVYHAGTGIVIRNTFNDKLYDARKEDKQYTYFVIANAGFTLKADSLKPYFKTATTTATDSLDKWNIIKDLVIDTLYPTAASLPNFITSKSGIVVPINKALIIDTKKVSNGIVYVFSSSGTITASKFRQYNVEGENPSGYSATTTAINIRIKKNPFTNANFSDIYVTAAVSGFYDFYRLTEMPSMKYNVYALAVNDFSATQVYESLIPAYVSSPTVTTLLPVVSTLLPTNTAQLSYTIPFATLAGATGAAPVASAYTEVFLGSFTSTLYGTLDIRLTSGGATLGSAGTGPLILDYFKLVPVP